MNNPASPDAVARHFIDADSLTLPIQLLELVGSSVDCIPVENETAQILLNASELLDIVIKELKRLQDQAKAGDRS